MNVSVIKQKQKFFSETTGRKAMDLGNGFRVIVGFRVRVRVGFRENDRQKLPKIVVARL